MIWFYRRGGEAFRIETRFDNDTAEYVAVLHHPDGTTESKRFKEAVEYREYLVKVERRLESDCWNRSGGPEFLRDGWPQKGRE